MGIEALMRELAARLERISVDHAEIGDTMVRERIWEVVDWYFTWGNTEPAVPREYFMFSKQGNEAIADALEGFFQAAAPLLTDVPVGLTRHRLLYDSGQESTTATGATVPDFIGDIFEEDVMKPTAPPETDETIRPSSE